MIKNFLIFILFLYSFVCCSQDTINKNFENKYQIYFKTSGCYKNFFGNRYIEPTPYFPDEKFQAHQFDGFTKMPSCGFSTGFLLSCKLSEHWQINSGLMYFLRKDVFRNNLDTVTNYGSSTTIRSIDNVVKYDYIYNNLELPVLIQYQWNKINFYSGFHFSLLSYRKANYTYVTSQFPQNPTWVKSKKSIYAFEIPLLFYPTFQMSYDLKIKNIFFKPFIGIDFYKISFKDFNFHIENPFKLSILFVEMGGIKTENCFYMHGGLILPLNNFIKRATSK